MTHQNLQNASKAMLSGKVTTLNVYIRQFFFLKIGNVTRSQKRTNQNQGKFWKENNKQKSMKYKTY